MSIRDATENTTLFLIYIYFYFMLVYNYDQSMKTEGNILGSTLEYCSGSLEAASLFQGFWEHKLSGLRGQM